jgi:hypothetical protein
MLYTSAVLVSGKLSNTKIFPQLGKCHAPIWAYLVLAAAGIPRSTHRVFSQIERCYPHLSRFESTQAYQ